MFGKLAWWALGFSCLVTSLMLKNPRTCFAVWQCQLYFVYKSLFHAHSDIGPSWDGFEPKQIIEGGSHGNCRGYIIKVGKWHEMRKKHNLF